MKKLISIILVLMLCLSLSACVKGEQGEVFDGTDSEIKQSADNSVEPNVNNVSDVYTTLYSSVKTVTFELPTGNELTVHLAYDEYGRLKNTGTALNSVMPPMILSDSEIIIEAIGWDDHQLYIADIDTLEVTPLLSDEVYGHTYDEYYESVTKKQTWLEWCANPVLNAKSGNTDNPTIAYYSNKYAEDGVITNEENCWDYGAIWLLDLNTGEETRITSPDGGQISPNGFGWYGTRDICFISSTGGVDSYVAYNIETHEFTVAGLNHDEICALIDKDIEFYEFSRFYLEGLDKSDSIEGYFGTYYCVTDERFDTPEKLEEYLYSHYEEEYIINDLCNYLLINDGKVYRAENDREFDRNRGYRFDSIRIREDCIILTAYTQLKNDTDFVLCTLYSFYNTEDGWKIGWADRNCRAREGWYNKDDFTGLPITAEEIAALIEQDNYIWTRLHTNTFAVSKPGEIFEYDEGYVEKEAEADNWTYRYYKVVDPNFDTWEKWEDLVRSVYSDAWSDVILRDPVYTDIDGALYVKEAGGMGYYGDRERYVWHVIDYTDDTVTIVKRFGDLSENCEDIISESITLIKTPDGWRIDSLV